MSPSLTQRPHTDHPRLIPAVVVSAIQCFYYHVYFQGAPRLRLCVEAASEIAEQPYPSRTFAPRHCLGYLLVPFALLVRIFYVNGWGVRSALHMRSRGVRSVILCPVIAFPPLSDPTPPQRREFIYVDILISCRYHLDVRCGGSAVADPILRHRVRHARRFLGRAARLQRGRWYTSSFLNYYVSFNFYISFN